MIVAGNKQKWVPINIELPKSSRVRRNWQARRDQPPASAAEGPQPSAGGKDDSANVRHRDEGQTAVRRSDGSPRKDRKDRRDVIDRPGRDQGRPNSAKASAAPSKKGKFTWCLLLLHRAYNSGKPGKLGKFFNSGKLGEF